MKKRFSILSVILCVVVAALCIVGCSDHGAPDHNTKNPSYAVSQDNLKNELIGFMEDNIDRTTFTDGEKKAAEYLQKRLSDIGYTDVALQSFTAKEEEMTGLESQNVVARLGTKSNTAKNVIIGTYYDNRHAAPYKGGSYDGGEGVMAGGTSVATLLGIAEYFVKNQSKISAQLNITIVFFGASYIQNTGVRAFMDKMDAAEYKNTVLMIELQRLTGDHVYAFSDARATKREKFFDRVAADNGLDIYKVTSKSPLITGLSALNGVPYYQWAHSGAFNVFFNAGVPTLNLMGANWESSNLSDIESTKHANLSYTENDTFINLKKYHPDYADKMAAAATLVIRSVCDKEFLSVMQYDRDNFPDTDVLAASWIWRLVALAIIFVAAAAMYAVGTHIRKKYPIEIPAPPQMKMAVFGMDYEDKSSADIFIDIRENGINDDIFEGIANNAPKSNDPFDDIFPPQSGSPQESGEAKSDNKQNDDPFGPPDDKNQ
ncbi:MAG: M28 family peptidase [Clostridiales bacterium]|nr:M28 family peptidase [Clostridiales bacterium]